MRTKYLKNYRLLHLQHLKKLQHMWYIKNKKKSNQKSKLYRQLHAGYLKAYHASYFKQKYISNINFRLSCILRSRLRSTVKVDNRSQHMLPLVGCSIGFLRHYLEAKFTRGMSWNNYGKWHIDHIKPCASFDLSRPEEQRKCFHYTNLQPLWAKDNYSKGKRLVFNYRKIA